MGTPQKNNLKKSEVSGLRGAAILQRSIGHRLAGVQPHPSPLIGNSSSAAAIAAAALARQSSLQNLSAAAAAGLHGPL